MPGQKRDFTEKHRAAVAKCRAETGKSHAEIAELAASEGLYGISFPRKPSLSTVQDWCNREVDLDSIKRRLLVALDATITLELEKREGPNAIGFIKQCLSAVERPEPKRHRGEKSPKDETPVEEALRSESLERLARAAKQDSGNGTAEPNPKPQDTDGGETQPLVAHGQEAEATSESGVGGRAPVDASDGEASRVQGPELASPT